jgi:hypothetical protein
MQDLCFSQPMLLTGDVTLCDTVSFGEGATDIATVKQPTRFEFLGR